MSKTKRCPIDQQPCGESCRWGEKCDAHNAALGDSGVREGETPLTDAAVVMIDMGPPSRTEEHPFVPADIARALERQLHRLESELSKVMPPDFKDWWQNSKDEWPVVARLVLEARKESEESLLDQLGVVQRQLAEMNKKKDALMESVAVLLNERDVAIHRAIDAEVKLAEARTALDTVRFHLRRNDHVSPPTGASCTNQMIDRIDKALARLDGENATVEPCGREPRSDNSPNIEAP